MGAKRPQRYGAAYLKKKGEKKTNPQFGCIHITRDGVEKPSEPAGYSRTSSWR
jgi:hypothetical protein